MTGRRLGVCLFTSFRVSFAVLLPYSPCTCKTVLYSAFPYYSLHSWLVSEQMHTMHKVVIVHKPMYLEYIKWLEITF
jgi:hypothetical protein